MKNIKICANAPKNVQFVEFVNTNGDLAYWEKIFFTLKDTDAFAPMLAIMGLLNLVTDSGCPKLSTPYAQSYAWLGELMADAEREEIEDAAEATGFLAKGLNDFVLFALCPDNKNAYCATVWDLISSSRARHLREDVLTIAKMQLRNKQAHI